MLHLFIDGSAKENFIGAGLIIVESHQASPITQSFHMKLNHPATSTIAEFFALRKALEWIQEHQPENDIMIFSDSQDVTSTPTHPMTPPDVLQLLHQLQTSFPHQIHIEQARNQHQPYIDKAHHASRKYRAIMPKGPWSTTRSTIPALGSHAWI
ncbi:reverse transcriptase-like protein, partial [Robertmurraya sp.]|uniref:reverse transcriptase-like protein n=1 Tax=Robertmurraya sp. TaxID=2837525 RepID=UPI0037038938